LAKSNKAKSTSAVNSPEVKLHPLVAGPQPSIERVEHVGRMEHRVEKHHIERHEGPIPSPDVFKRYGEVVPDAPERILKVFEQDSQHTREMQKIAITGEVSRDARAQWMAFAIMIAALGVTTYSIIAGKNITAAIAGLGTLFLTLGVLFGDKKGKKPKEPNPDDE